MKQFISKGNNRIRLTSIIFTLMVLISASFFSVPVDATVTYNPIQTNAKFLYQAGTSYVYDWHVDFTSLTHTKSLDEVTLEPITNVVETRARLTAKARFIPQTVSTTSENTIVMFIEDPKFFRLDEDNNEVEELNEEIIPELMRPVFFTQLPDGRVNAVFAEPDEDLSSLNLKKGVISALHTVLYDDTQGAEIIGQPEEDVSGTYTPRFSSITEGDFLTITKNRNDTDYTQFANLGGLEQAEDLDFNETTVSRFNTITGVVESATVDHHLQTIGETDTIPEDGVQTWAETIGTGSLTLIATEPDPTPYSMAGLVPVNLTGTDFEILDEEEPVTTEALTQMAVNPTNPTLFDKISRALKRNPSSVEAIRKAFRNRTINHEMHPVIIDALGALGTPEAQDILIRHIIQKRRVSIESKERAVSALGLVINPTENTISVLENLSEEKSDPLSLQAALMIGAAAEKFAVTHPQRAAGVIKNLETMLFSTTDSREIDVYLDALGNAGSNASAHAIGAFLYHPSAIIRHTAVTALRKLTSPEAVQYLRQAAASDSSESIRQTAVSLLNERGDEETARIMASYDYNWNYKIGSGSVYGKVFATLHADNNNGNSNFYLYAKGEAKAYAWKWNWSVFKGEAKSEVINNSRKFSAKAYVFGYQVYSTQHYLTCGASRSGTLWNRSYTFFNVGWNFYPWGIKVRVSIKATGNVSVTYSYGMNACNAPVTADAYATVTPGGSITASGSASVSIYAAKAGVTLETKLLNTTLPTTLRGIAGTSSPYLKINLNSTLSMQPVSGRLYLWAKVRRGLWRWRTVFSKNLWTFSGRTYTRTMYNKWYYVW